MFEPLRDAIRRTVWWYREADLFSLPNRLGGCIRDPVRLSEFKRWHWMGCERIVVMESSLMLEIIWVGSVRL